MRPLCFMMCDERGARAAFVIATKKAALLRTEATSSHAFEIRALRRRSRENKWGGKQEEFR